MFLFCNLSFIASPLCLSFFFFVYLVPSVSIFLSFFLSLSICVCASLLSLSLFLSLSLSLYIYIYVYIHHSSLFGYDQCELELVTPTLLNVFVHSPDKNSRHDSYLCMLTSSYTYAYNVMMMTWRFG